MKIAILGCLITCLMGIATREKEIFSERNKDNFVTVQYNEIHLNKPFDINIAFNIKNQKIDRTKDFDFKVIMPSHGHGMNVNPIIGRKRLNYFVFKRLLLHMPGLWQFQLTVHLKDGRKDMFSWEHYLSI